MSEAAEASQYYFFEKILIKLKCPYLPNVLQPFFKLRIQLQLAILDFKLCHIELEHPVLYNTHIVGAEKRQLTPLCNIAAATHTSTTARMPQHACFSQLAWRQVLLFCGHDRLFHKACFFCLSTFQDLTLVSMGCEV